MKFPKKDEVMFLAGSFFAGFSLMVIELLAVRIMAPVVGSSVFTWTSSIGVMLFGLSFGSYFGGITADKLPKKETLGIAFLFSSIAVATIPLFEYTVSDLIFSQKNILILNLFFSFALFLTPSFVLGTIQPIILKLYAKNQNTVGEKYGLLSALWSAGSILGVFLTGFYMISHFGILSILYGVSVILLLFGILFFWQEQEKTPRIKKYFGVGFIFLFLIIGLYNLFLFLQKEVPRHPILYEKNSAYYHIKVIDAPFGQGGDSRLLFLDADVHSRKPKTEEKSFTYTDIYPIFDFIHPPKTIHVIGGGAYTLPKNFTHYYPKAKVSVSEIDEEVEKVTEKYFNLDLNAITTDFSDPRVFFHTSNISYDLIFGDAYGSFISVPGHLLTYEFNESVKRHLNRGGIYALNIASATEGKNSLLFQSVYKTFIKTFPNAIVVAFSLNPLVPQNITIIGTAEEKPMNRTLIKKQIDILYNKNWLNTRIVPDEELANQKSGIVLTDDFAPVENLMIPAVEDYFKPYFELYKPILGKKLFLTYN
jgi:predicted membrane-bound spermidine synthase